MEAYALNPKWYIPRPGRIPPIDDPEIKNGFRAAISKMYTSEDGKVLRWQWIQFASLTGPCNKLDTKEDRDDLGRDDPIGWWKFHGDDAPEIKHLATHLLSQIASSSTAERNWSTYSFIHSIRRNRLTFRRAEKIVVVHSALRLAHRKTPGYRMGAATRWDVDPEEDAQVDEEDGPDEMQHGLVGVPLVTHESDSDSDSDTPIDGPDAFMQQMDAEDESMDPTP